MTTLWCLLSIKLTARNWRSKISSKCSSASNLWAAKPYCKLSFPWHICTEAAIVRSSWEVLLLPLRKEGDTQAQLISIIFPNEHSRKKRVNLTKTPTFHWHTSPMVQRQLLWQVIRPLDHGTRNIVVVFCTQLWRLSKQSHEAFLAYATLPDFF